MAVVVRVNKAILYQGVPYYVGDRLTMRDRDAEWYVKAGYVEVVEKKERRGRPPKAGKGMPESAVVQEVKAKNK